MAKKKKEEKRLEKSLVLNAYLNGLFGKKTFEDFRQILKDTKPGFDEEGHSHIYYVLASQKDLLISKGELEEYDSNIKQYVDHINRLREKPVELKYFQYLAVLFTEIYLDAYFKDPVKLLNQLNDSKIAQEYELYFSRDDLNKLAFWMATGSGKTLIMHINLLQFKRYNTGTHKLKFDNLLLITSSESMSNQHIQELKQSSIACDLFSNSDTGYFSELAGENYAAKVLDIHKLTEEKKGQGVTIDIESFGGKNLVFVDEGHKGSGGVKWKRFREEIAKEGFTLEYSATFGQAVATNNELFGEYAKASIFDYSYRHFYNDGYGKEYRILNLKDKSYSGDTRDTLMLANLLSFYEQLILFQNYEKIVDTYNIEKPLWIFVGSKVKGEKEQSDILQIIEFLSKFLKNEDGWVIKTIEKILKGNSGLLDTKDRDLFSLTYPEQKLKYLESLKWDADAVYTDILKKVFRTNSAAPLHLINIKNAAGEIALRAKDSDFFGVINIGDDAQFLKAAGEAGYSIGVDDVSPSLFNSINQRNSNINLLIGAKKFIEGWNCWRVSNMGLLNIGKKEGTQIIQLFGRGVRLRGKDSSLKRSSRYEPNPPENLPVLETLNIFGIEADYMEQFREYLKVEGISTENYAEFKIPIKIDEKFLNKDLMIPKVDGGKFRREEFITLKVDDRIHAHLDLMPTVEVLSSQSEKGIQTTRSNPPRKISQEYLNLLDWGKLYFQLLEHKIEKGWNNLVFSKKDLKEIVEKELYTLYCPEELVNPQKFEDLGNMMGVVESILKKYINMYYSKYKNTWLARNMEIIKLEKSHENINFEEYTFKIKEDDTLVFSEIKSIIDSRMEEIYGNFNEGPLKNVYIDSHIYQPLIAESGTLEALNPQGLNEGEMTFIKDLKDYLQKKAEALENSEVFILRNLPRRGLGFFETTYFYPDFIIWVKRGDTQHLLFVDPKGLAHAWEGLKEEKIRLHTEIKEIEKEINKKITDKKIVLDSFIISITQYDDIRTLFRNRSRRELKEEHILFQQDDKNYIDEIMKTAFGS